MRGTKPKPGKMFPVGRPGSGKMVVCLVTELHSVTRPSSELGSAIVGFSSGVLLACRAVEAQLRGWVRDGAQLRHEEKPGKMFPVYWPVSGRWAVCGGGLGSGADGEPFFVGGTQFAVAGWHSDVDGSRFSDGGTPFIIQFLRFDVRGQRIAIRGWRIPVRGRQLANRGRAIPIRGLPVVVRGRLFMDVGWRIAIRGQPFAVQEEQFSDWEWHFSVGGQHC